MLLYNHSPQALLDYAPINLPTAESHKEDYHHRQSVKSEKKFKLVPNRLSYRPRLTIRRPGNFKTLHFY